MEASLAHTQTCRQTDMQIDMHICTQTYRAHLYTSHVGREVKRLMGRQKDGQIAHQTGRLATRFKEIGQ